MAVTTLPDLPAQEQDAPADPWYNAMAGVIVVTVGLLVLLGIIGIAILAVPDGDSKAQNITTLASAGVGVVGTIVGAYFGVRAANRAVDRAHGR